ncbi:internal scaffolding protein [Blackfly microvirus SF02]|uniref:Internal scaffolding protein n=1 Tax=Blackfly microvirus SF02 TaxID=2576452 RepID=A0A4P8PL96_9VIRU|nr:internal scaffolding protein [Blackfly microvirus SF02]
MMTGYAQGVNTDGEVIRDFYVEHAPVDLACPDDGMTRQEFADECDINVLMATYERNGQLTHINAGSPQFLDVSDVPDLPRAIAVMEAAEKAFMTLPASVRREFDNSAVNFVDYAADRGNLDQMRKWGLAPPAAAADAVSEPVVRSSPQAPSKEP